MRTLRARTVRTVPAANRLYIQLGETVFAYALSTFFDTRLVEPMIPVNDVSVTPASGQGWGGRNGVYEKLARPDAFFYPEDGASGWTCPQIDTQRALHFYDLDDRGYLYAVTPVFGWGIQQDDGRTVGTHLPFVYQDTQSYAFQLGFVIRNGASYYFVASENDPNRFRIYDVTNPEAPIHLGARSGSSIRAFAKDDLTQRLVIGDSSRRLRVYSYAGFIANEAPLAEYTASGSNAIRDVTFDDSGNIWAVEGPDFGSTAGQLWKLSASTLAKTMYDYSSSYGGYKVHASAGYVAVMGTPGNGYGVRLYDVRSGIPAEIDIDDFFRKYYFRSPSGYAQPYIYQEAGGVRIVKQNAKTYLMISAGGLGDVYELPTYERSVRGLAPASGPPAGGTVVTIEGVNLDAGTPAVTFGGVNATGVTVTNGRIIAVAPPNAPGAVDVVVSYTGSLPLTVPQQFTYRVAAPQNFIATGNGASVTLTWNAVPTATTYDVERRTGDAWNLLSSRAGTGYVDHSVSSAQTYVYRVRASAGTYASAYAMDVATTMPMSTSTLSVGMPVLASHIIDVQNGVNALRAAAGLANANFPSINAGTKVRREHITDPRISVNEARTALGLAPRTFTHATPTIVRAIHVNELLDAVR
jgi:hypothetical protein